MGPINQALAMSKKRHSSSSIAFRALAVDQGPRYSSYKVSPYRSSYRPADLSRCRYRFA